jgi:hypothetical protein
VDTLRCVATAYCTVTVEDRTEYVCGKHLVQSIDDYAPLTLIVRRVERSTRCRKTITREQLTPGDRWWYEDYPEQEKDG